MLRPGHEVQLPRWGSPYVPAGHWQDSASLLPPGETDPAGHAAHVASAPDPEEWNPELQRQSATLRLPRGEKELGGHVAQRQEARASPGPARYVDPGHAHPMTVSLPAEELEPVGQSVHSVPDP